MNRRRAIIAALIAAFAPRTVHASNVSATCPAPFIREVDPVKALFDADLRAWANTNRHIPQATVIVHQVLASLVPLNGEVYAHNTTFRVVVAGYPVPWVIVPICPEGT